MSNNPNYINVGTPENPVMVSGDILHPETPEGQEEWEGIATGSIIIPHEALENLIKQVSDEKH